MSSTEDYHASIGASKSILCLVLLCFVYQAIQQWLRYYRSWVRLPVVGHSGLIASRIDGLSWSTSSSRIIQEGYNKHRDHAFQFRTSSRWEVCLCDEGMIREYMMLPDDCMSLEAYNEGVFALRYTSPGFSYELDHIPVTTLSKALIWARGRGNSKTDPYFEGLVAELEITFEKEVQVTKHNWTTLHCLQVGLGLMLRLLGRVLVGEPLCRDLRAMDMIVRYGVAVPISGARISWMPTVLQRLLGPYAEASRLQAELTELILCQMRQAQDKSRQPESIADWMGQWVREEARGQYNEINVAQMIVSALFGSVHSAGMTLADCLHSLALRPVYIEALRKEAEMAIQQHGALGKDAIESMTKLDSFIRECQRWTPLASTALHRVAVRDYTFKNGLFIPKGTGIVTPNTPILRDSHHYNRPEEFDGFRFHKLGQATGNRALYKITGSSPKSRQFGDGRHSCPGKQLAADMLRLILAYFLLHVDVVGEGTLHDNSQAPIDQWKLVVRKR